MLAPTGEKTHPYITFTTVSDGIEKKKNIECMKLWLMNPWPRTIVSGTVTMAILITIMTVHRTAKFRFRRADGLANIPPQPLRLI